MVKKTPMTAERKAKILAELERDVAARQRSYRECALRIYPHVCANCGREFEGKRLKELTVHHRDHNHDNNPPDGSNWILLCIYCHDHEHDKSADAKYINCSTQKQEAGPSIFFPFEGLDIPKPDDNASRENDQN